MTTYNTGNPIGSTDPKDLYDNAQNLDALVNSTTELSHADRMAVQRKTWHGIEVEFAQFLADSAYQDLGVYGAGIEVTRYNQVFLKDGEFYRAAASLGLPYTTTGVWASESGSFVGVGDAVLRQDLGAHGGSGLVGYDGGTAQSVLDNAKAMANYTDLRAYTGRATGVRITQSGLAGFFQRDDADTISADNGGTIIVDGAGRRWKRLYSEPLNIKWFGGVADYTGTPLYDGADAGRVTATDNTTAFQNLVSAAIAAGHDSVRIPAGHWGIKTGNLSFASLNKLRIFGDGIGVTILDFIKEDASNTGATYVDEAKANVIASFTAGNYLEFQDLTVKATTKAGLVNGPAGMSYTYQGAVWGFNINNVKDVRFTRVRAERFNYRGFNVYGSATERVTLLHCEGFLNTATGYWIRDAALLKIVGGEFAYNGILGEPGTGYGVTGSARIGKLISKRAYYHHNYRKGLDTHGCGGFEAIGNIFEDNVINHIAAPNWEVPAGISDVQFIIKGNTFSNGSDAASRAFLQECYQAIVAAGYSNASDVTGGIVSVTDTTNNGTRINKISRIVFADNTVVAHYNGQGLASFGASSGQNAIVLWVRDDGVVEWSGNRINLAGFKINATSSRADSAIPISIPFGSWTLNGDAIIWPEDAAYTNTNYSVIAPTSITWGNNRVTINLPSGHNFQNNEIVTVAGADQAGYNGTFVLTRVSADVYQYYASNPGAPTATGAITVTVSDRITLVTTNGINIDARNATFHLKNARLFGSTSSGRRSQATFNTKTRNFSGCAFSFSTSPFDYIDDEYFIGNQQTGVINCHNNTYSNRGLQCRLPDVDFNRTQSEIVYRFPSVSKTVGQDVFYVVLGRAYQQTVYISTKDGGSDLRIDVPFSTLESITGSTGNALFELSSVDPFFSDAGAAKIKVTIKAKAGLSGAYWGRITVNGGRAGLGVERVVQL